MGLVKFQLDPAETPGERNARFARESVQSGTMGAFLNRADYLELLRIWETPSVRSQTAEQLSLVHTSCAVVASSLTGHSGKPLRKPWHADGSWGICDWLGVSFHHESWFDVSKPCDGGAGCKPLPPEIMKTFPPCKSPICRAGGWDRTDSFVCPSCGRCRLCKGHTGLWIGDVIYRGGKQSPMGHVQTVSELLDNGLARVVEGGGNLRPEDMTGLSQSDIKRTNGTVTRMTPPEGKNLFTRDSLGRVPDGWWRPILMGVPTYEDLLEQLRQANPTQS